MNHPNIPLFFVVFGAYAALIFFPCRAFAEGTTSALPPWPKPTPWQRRRHTLWKVVKGLFAAAMLSGSGILTVRFTLPFFTAELANIYSMENVSASAPVDADRPKPLLLRDNEGREFRLDHYSGELYRVVPLPPQPPPAQQGSTSK